ncbi:MAG: DUF1697 domain-containing protein [Pseudomonadales bacterium]
MTTQVAFLRAINVGGRNKVKMDTLKGAFAAAGCRDVRTYIQSGNVIYEAPATGQATLSREIQIRVNRLVDGEALVIFRTLRHLEGLVSSDPFKEFAVHGDTKQYVVFLAGRPHMWPDFPLEEPNEALRVLSRTKNDVFIVSGRKKNGRYGFLNSFIKTLDVAATSRNWNTITKIVAKFG